MLQCFVEFCGDPAGPVSVAFLFHEADGLSGGAINKNDEIKALVGKLQDLKAGAPAVTLAEGPLGSIGSEEASGFS